VPHGIRGGLPLLYMCLDPALVPHFHGVQERCYAAHCRTKLRLQHEETLGDLLPGAVKQGPTLLHFSTSAPLQEYSGWLNGFIDKKRLRVS